MSSCFFDNDFFKNKGINAEDAIKLTLFTRTDEFKQWYGNKEPELIGNDLINLNNEIITTTQILGNFNKVTNPTELISNNKLKNEKVAVDIAQMLGLLPFSDETSAAIPTPIDRTYMPKIQKILSKYSKIKNDSNDTNIYGDDYINVNHLTKDDTLIMFAPALLTTEDKSLIDFAYNIIKTNDNPISDTDKKILVLNQFYIIESINNLELKAALYNIAQRISIKLGRTDIVISPLESMYNIINNVLDLVDLSAIEYQLNEKEVIKEVDNSFTSYVAMSMRKFIFSIILDNLKSKFGIDYKWVKGGNFYGRLANGIVELNEDNFTDETPFHEYFHVILLSLQKDNPTLYDDLINSPEVNELSQQLSRMPEYAGYANEEALVRILSKEHSTLKISTIFKELVKWLSNVFKKVFNIKNKNIDILSVDMNIGLLNKIMLDNNKYILNTNYIKGFDRYNYDLFNEFVTLNESKDLTRQQKDAIGILQKHRDKLIGTIQVDPTNSDYYLFTKPDGTKIKLLRSTAIDKKDIDFNTNVHALGGTFIHSTFETYLKLRHTGMVKPTDDNLDTLIDDLYFDTKSKFYTYKTNKPGERTSAKPYVQSADENNTFNANVNATTRKRFRDAILQLMNDSDDETKTLIGNFTDWDMKQLLLTMNELEDSIIDKISSTEDLPNISLNDLLIFSEMFTHNYNESSNEQQYAGTLDIFVISPTGKKYIFDIKTIGKSTFNHQNRFQGKDESLFKKSKDNYSVQQSAYKEFVANIFGDSTVNNIESDIIFIQRAIDFNWSDADIVIAYDSIIDAITNVSVTTSKEQAEKDNALKSVHAIFNKPSNVQYADKTKKSLLQNISFQSASLFDIAMVTNSDIKIILKYFNKHNIDKKIVPKPTTELLRIKTPFEKDPRRIKRIPLLYDKKKLSDKGVNILSEISNHKYVVELSDLISIIDKTLYKLEDDKKTKETLLNNNPTDESIIRELDSISEKVKKLKNLHTDIIIQLHEFADKYNSAPTDDELNDFIAKSKLKLYNGDWQKFKSVLNKSFLKNDNYKKYLTHLRETINYIKDYLAKQDNIISADKTSLETLEKEKKSLIERINQIQINNSTGFSIIKNINNADSIAALVNGTTNKTLTDLYNNLINITFQINNLKTKINNTETHFANISSYKKQLENTQNDVRKLGSLQIIIHDAEFHKNNIINILENIIKDSSIPTDTRAYYYEYVVKTIALYSNIQQDIYGKSDILSVGENAFEKPHYDQNITKLELEFKALDVKAQESFQVLLADLMSIYSNDVIDLKSELHKIEASVKMYEEWISILHTNRINLNDTVNSNLNIFVEGLKPTSDIDDVKNNLQRKIESRRKSNLDNILKQLNSQIESPALHWINEQFLTSLRSKYSILQLYAILENRINQNYANSYDVIMEEIQKKSVEFLNNYKNDIVNRLKIGSYTIADEQYQDYLDLLAIAQDPNFSTDDEAINYLLTYDKALETYNYEQIFDDQDLALLSNVDKTNKAAIRNIILSNNLINKYKNIQTIRLIDRANYGYDKVYHVVYRTVTELQRNDISETDNYKRTDTNKKKLITIRHLFELKNDNSEIFNAIHFKFIDYIKYIIDTYENMIVLNNIKDNTDKKNNLYDIEALFGNNSGFIDHLKVVIATDGNGNNTESFDIDIINKNNGYFGKMLKDILSNVSDNTVSLFEIAEELSNSETDRLSNYFNSAKYAAIFIQEGLESYEKFLSKFDNSVKIDELTLEAKLKQEIDILDTKLRDKKITQENYDNAIHNINKKYNNLKINSKLKIRLNINPFTYLTLKNAAKDMVDLRRKDGSQPETESGRLNTNDESVTIFSNLLKIFENDELNKIHTDDKYIPMYLIKNPTAYKYIAETGSTKHFDNRWDTINNSDVAYNYYTYIREILAKLYNSIPQQERHGASKLDLPYLEDSGIFEIIERDRQNGVSMKATMANITGYLKQKFIEKTTSAIQNNETKLGMSIAPVVPESHLELRKKLKDANFQISPILQMLAYNALLYKTRSETEPIHNVITSIAKQSPNKQLSAGAEFYHHTNLMGVIPKAIDESADSNLTAADKLNLKRWEFQLNALNVEKEKLKTELKELKDYKNLTIYSDIDADSITLSDDTKANLDSEFTGDEKNEIIDKLNYKIVKLKAAISTIDSTIQSLKSKGDALKKSRKPDSIDKVRTLVNAARLVQLSYSLTGQIGNFMNGMLQTSIVASGSDIEMKAFKDSIAIINDLMFKNKVLLGAAYGGNIVTSALIGSGTGILSIPVWMMLAKSGLDQMKDLNYIKSKFSPELMKAFNMERYYNITFDVVEQARAGIKEDTYFKYDKNTNSVIKNDDDFANMLKPFDFVKRAEKMIAILNMLIQSFVTTININGKEMSFWDLHDENGQVKAEYEPYINKDVVEQWTRQLNDRLIKANGNYTNKAQIESHWVGQLLLVYAKWIPETMRTFWGDFTSSEENLYSNNAQEGLMRSTYKKGVETYYNLMKNLIVTDFPPLDFERKEIVKNSNKGSVYDRLIIYKNGKIIHNHIDKDKFVEAYNRLVAITDTFGDSVNLENEKTQEQYDIVADKFKNEFNIDLEYSAENYFDINLSNLAKHYNIKFLKDIEVEEKKSIFSKIKDTIVSFLVPFDFKESFRERTITRNVTDRLHKLMPDLNGDYNEYEKVQYANLRRFYNYTHMMYSMYLSKMLLMMLLGYMTKVLDFDDDDDRVKNLKFIINRYNQLWRDVSYYSNPVSAFYNYFHNSMTSIKFALDLMKFNVDVAAALPHGINMLLGDSEIGDITLEAMGLRDPIIEHSNGITSVRPVNDFVDMIPLFNKMASMKKQLENDYSKYDQ